MVGIGALNSLVAALVMLALGVFATKGARTRNPGRLQLAFEAAVEGLRTLYLSILGEGGEGHLTFVFALFFFILFCNLIGFIPLFHSPTANLSTTVALALIVFVYVQYVGIKPKGCSDISNTSWGRSSSCSGSSCRSRSSASSSSPSRSRCVCSATSTARTSSTAWPSAPVPISSSRRSSVINLLQTFTDVVQAFIFALLTCAYIAIMSDTHDEHEGDLGAAQEASDAAQPGGADRRHPAIADRRPAAFNRRVKL